MTAPGQRGAQLDVVLDDTVMNDRDRAALCGWALPSDGRPCVAHRVWPIPIEPLSGEPSSARRKFSSLPTARRISIPAPLIVATPGRVVAAILQAREPAEQNRHRLGRAHVSNYSAHEFQPFPAY